MTMLIQINKSNPAGIYPGGHSVATERAFIELVHNFKLKPFLNFSFWFALTLHLSIAKCNPKFSNYTFYNLPHLSKLIVISYSRNQTAGSGDQPFPKPDVEPIDRQMDTPRSPNQETRNTWPARSTPT